MPQLPQAADYGAGQNLRVNRSDSPGSGQLESSNALVQASNTFAAVMLERKQKVDKLHYALARNDLIKADLIEREKLAEDQDWKTHDQRYGEGYRAAREKISAHFELDPHDQAILEAEGDLIGVRGGIAVRGAANEQRVEQGYTSLLESNDFARQKMTMAKNFHDRNAIIDGQLEAINAANEEGYIPAEEAEVMRQSLTKDFALASLKSMSPEERKDALEASQAKRRNSSDPKVLTATDMGDGPVTAESLMEGGGTDSVADFLHGDVVAKMLDDATHESKADIDRGAAFAARDAAVSQYPGSEVAARRAISQDDSLTAGQKNIAEQEVSEHFSALERDKNRHTEAMVDIWSERIGSGEGRVNEITGAEQIALGAGGMAALAGAQQRYDQVEGQGFVRTDMIADPGDGRGSLQKWDSLPRYADPPNLSKATVPLENEMWRGSFTPKTWQDMRDTQAGLIADENARIYDNGVTPKAQVQRILNTVDIPKSDYDEILSTFTTDFEARIWRAQKKAGEKLSPEEENKILNEMWQQTAFVGVLGFDPEKRVQEMTAAELDKAYLSLEDAKAKEASGPEARALLQRTGQTMTVYELLAEKGRLANGDEWDADKNKQDVRRAYFALESGLATEEVERRLRGE